VDRILSLRISQSDSARGERGLCAEWIEPLTPRELQIRAALGRLATGHRGQLRSRAHRKFHVGQILAKLNAESRTGLS
jgi:hypothetical protein